MNRVFLLLAILFFPLAATAGNGWYFGLEGGANFAEDQEFLVYDFDPLNIQVVEDGSQVSDVGFDTGYLGGLFGGYAFPGGLRLELELVRRHDEFDSIDLADGRSSEIVEGEEDTDIAMANLWLDFFKSGSIHPYIGGGVGAARIDISDPAFDGTVLFINGSELRDDDDTVFAYQGGAGIGFDLTPQWTASLDYRYLKTEDGEFNLLENFPDSHVETEYESHSALLSIRYYFRGPPEPAPEPIPPPVEVVAAVEPPPPPPPPPCVLAEPGQPMDMAGCKTGDSLVLRGVNFLFDQSSLTVNAKVILDRVAEALKQRADIRIELSGHTDGKGSDSYNQQLSDRRAASVKQYFMERGVDGARITTVGMGETVPVADNANDAGRELNRRVELKVTAIDAALTAPIVDVPAADAAADPAVSPPP
ncbi:MAG: OmpA family protein [Panacagrimonas sp.]